MSEGRARRRAVPLLLAALASTVAACGFSGGDTIYPAGTCDDFVTMVRTSQPSYAPGQTVIISVTQVNKGPDCHGTPPEWCGNLGAFASAYNSAGEDVWDDGANPIIQGISTCPFAPAPGPDWPAGYSNTQKLHWSQDRCAFADEVQPGHRNANCPGTQVADGTYRIIGNSTSAPAIITISG